MVGQVLPGKLAESMSPLTATAGYCTGPIGTISGAKTSTGIGFRYVGFDPQPLTFSWLYNLGQIHASLSYFLNLLNVGNNTFLSRLL